MSAKRSGGRRRPGANRRRELRPPFDRYRDHGDGQLRFSRRRPTAGVGVPLRINRADPSRPAFLPHADGQRSAATRCCASLPPRHPHAVRLAPRQPSCRVATRRMRRWQPALVDGGHQSERSAPITSTHTNETDPAVSPDGRAWPTPPTKSTSIWCSFRLMAERAARSWRRRATSFDPAWSPAGDQFAFVTDRSGDSRSGREVATASGSGRSSQPRTSAPPDTDARRPGVFPRRSHAGLPAAGRRAVRSLAVAVDRWHAGSSAPQAPEESASALSGWSRWSPDGEWVACTTTTTGPAVGLRQRFATGTNGSVTLASDRASVLAVDLVAGRQMDRLRDHGRIRSYLAGRR